MSSNPIRADLAGNDRACALGLAARGSSPVLALCRALVAAGYDPALPLHAYRGDMLCLRVRSIGEGAKLTIWETKRGLAFVPWRPFAGLAVSE